MIHIGILDDNKTHLQIAELALNGSDNNWVETVRVSTFIDANELLKSLTSTDYDCLIIDRQIPGFDDDYVLKWIRANVKLNIPVIVMTANKSFLGGAEFLGIGADDYIIKPANPTELLLRVKRLIFNYRALNDYSVAPRLETANADQLIEELSSKYGVILDDTRSTVIHASQLIHLTELEYRLAKLFFTSIGKALSKEDIFRNIWPKGTPFNQRLLSTHVCRIRNKIELSPENNWVLRVVYGFGYRLDYLRNIEFAMNKGDVYPDEFEYECV